MVYSQTLTGHSSEYSCMEEIIENYSFNICTTLVKVFITSYFFSRSPLILRAYNLILTPQSTSRTLYHIKPMMF